MHLLHISSYYVSSELYHHLYQNLARYPLYQYVYIPVKQNDFINNNLLLHKKVAFKYDPIVKKHHKIAYISKIIKQMLGVENFLKQKIYEIDLIHAHTLFTDGGTAYLLKKKYGIKYCISVRSTDLHVFYKKAIHLRPFIYNVLKEAEKVYFISPSYKQKSYEIFPDEISKMIYKKSEVIPNGIKKEWLEKNVNLKKDLDTPVKLFFTGTLTKRKNLITVLKTIKDSNLELKLKVAGTGPELDNIKNYIKKESLNKNVELLGQLSMEELQGAMKNADIFLLPSLKETFGISYLEAMASGLPVIYTKNEGIDGLFPEGRVGYGVNPLSIKEIENAIKKITYNYNNLSFQARSNSENFSWDMVSSRLYNSYKNILIKN